MPILFKSLLFLRKNYVTHCNILLYIIIAVRLSGGQSRSSERRSRTLRAAGAVPTAILDRRSLLRVGERRRSGRSDGHGANRMIETGQMLLIIWHCSVPIKYRGLVIVLQQLLCQFSAPTKLSAHDLVGRSVNLFSFAEINSVMRNFGDEQISGTSQIVISFPKPPHQIARSLSTLCWALERTASWKRLAGTIRRPGRRAWRWSVPG